MTQRPSIKVFDEWRIRSVTTDPIAFRSAERAFRSLGKGLATTPVPMRWEFPKVNGEVHLKGAYLHGSPMFTLKVATGFYGNMELGVPTGAGFVFIFDADTGFPRGILMDNGHLTDLRTAAAGALAASHLAPKRPLDVAILGAGVQGQMQLRLVGLVREIRSLSLWSRTYSRSNRWKEKLEENGTMARTSRDVAEAVEGADLVITATPARSPLIEEGMLAAGATVIAVGADGPQKQELSAAVVAGADKVVTDLTSQCIGLGEVHHAIEGLADDRGRCLRRAG